MSGPYHEQNSLYGGFFFERMEKSEGQRRSGDRNRMSGTQFLGFHMAGLLRQLSQ